VSQKELDAVTATRDRLRAEFTSAESSLALAREGYRTEDVEAAEAAVELADAQMREAENSLADTRLFTPSGGTVITRVSEPGTVVAAGQPVCAVMLDAPIQVRAYVTEPQLSMVRLGMKGRIITDSPPGHDGEAPLEGRVSFIASEAEFTAKQVQTEDMRADLVYRIRLRLDENPEERLKNGMPVTVLLECLIER
jgi:HlyD family secretion protein